MSFTTTYTAFSNERFESVISVLEDIQNWPKWDTRLKSYKIEGEFSSNSTYFLTAEGVKQIPVKIEEIICHPDTQFRQTDTEESDFGEIKIIREVEAVEDHSIITRTMMVFLKEKKLAEEFARRYWPKLSEDTIQTTINLAKYVESKAKL